MPTKPSNTTPYYVLGKFIGTHFQKKVSLLDVERAFPDDEIIPLFAKDSDIKALHIPNKRLEPNKKKRSSRKKHFQKHFRKKTR